MKKLLPGIMAVVFFTGELALAQSDQAGGVKAIHRQGQTFITWKEVDPSTFSDKATVGELDKAISASLQSGSLSYRIYRSDKPVTSISDAKLVGESAPYSCWNLMYWHYLENSRSKTHPRYVIEEGKDPLPVGSGLYVHNPAQGGGAYYVVTVVKNGKENQTVGQDNTTGEVLQETSGPGVPVLQKSTADWAKATGQNSGFNYVGKCSVDEYVRWDCPPNASVENRPNNYLVALPHDRVKPTSVGLHLHCWGGDMFGGYGYWHYYKGGSVLISSNQEPYDWWTGYHEKFWDIRKDPSSRNEKNWKDGVVRPYSQNRMISFLDWATAKYELDKNRVFVAGNSMGGSGAIMMAIRNSQKFAWCNSWVGIHNPRASDHFRGSYENCYGMEAWGVKMEDGTAVWDYFNDIWYLKKNVKAGMPLLVFCNGKDDYAISWPQAAEMVKTLQETRQPHIFVWELAGHSSRSKLPITLGDAPPMVMDLQVNLSLPAFTRCSLDDDPGTGKKIVEGNPQAQKNAYDGADKGQVNLYLAWETSDIVDNADGWEITAFLVGQSPKDSCQVDITPRRTQTFLAKPGDKFTWTNTSLADNKEIQTGQVTADENGLVTLEKVQINKTKNRIKIKK